MDDGDDVCLIYYAGHGNYMHLKVKKLGVDIPIDLPPFDEDDRCDEYLTTYWTGKNPFAIITDDLFNRLLDRLDAKGVAVILGSCFSGGMYDSNNTRGILGRLNHFKNKFSEWMKKFSEDICKKGRVVIMASRENESAYGIDKTFVDYIREGLQGYADSNDDGMVSAEEVFQWAVPEYFNQFPEHQPANCQPVMEDNYPGELLLSIVELPPSTPNITCPNELIGLPNSIFIFNATSIDPEGDNIRYGWNWQNDRWTTVEEWSEYHHSGDVCTMSHRWDEAGVYRVKVKSQDEHGVEIIPNYIWYEERWTRRLWTESLYVLIHGQDETVDQYQLKDEGDAGDIFYENYSLAQSFRANTDSLSKIKIKLSVNGGNDWCSEEKQKYPVNVSIRSNLSDQDIVKISKTNCNGWVEFNFTTIEVIPGETYYIVVTCNSNKQIYIWKSGRNNPYQEGEGYMHDRNIDGSWSEWQPLRGYLKDNDFCFITYE